MKETKVQISQLQQAIRKLQSQIENLKKQVGVPELLKPYLLRLLCQSHRWVCVKP